MKTKYKYPVVVIAGRPNVGKSTLFNRLLSRRRAIVDPTPGVTRDPIEAEWQPPYVDDNTKLILVDTGGLKLEQDAMDALVAEKSQAYIEMADLVLFLLDAVNITPEDEEFAAKLRRFSDKVVVVVNKADSPERDARAWAHASWGYKNMVFVSAEHGRNIDELCELIVTKLKLKDINYADIQADEPSTVKVAIMGKPNVGKSTLLNALLNENKSIVSNIPGTTRDVIEGSFIFNDRVITVLDTAGIRRKAKVTDNVEYYSVNRAIKTIDVADVVIIMIDAVEGLSDQDKKITKLATDKGRAIIFALNKWDTMPNIKNTFEAAKDKLQYFFAQMAWAPILPLSAQTKEGIPKLLKTVLDLHKQLNTKIETSKLNKAVKEWVEHSPPPASPKARFKLRYAVQSKTNPVEFIIFATRPDIIAESYRSYLKNKIRTELGFSNIPIEIEMRASRKRFEDLDKA